MKKSVVIFLFSILLVSFGGLLSYIFLAQSFKKNQQDATFGMAENAMVFARDLIAEKGEIRLQNDQIYAGTFSLHNNDIPQKVKKATNFGCTVFLGNIRIATTATSKGSDDAAIGTTANEHITQTVLFEKNKFKGITYTIGKDWLIIYEPLYDNKNKCIGMLAVYQDYSEFIKERKGFEWLLGTVIFGLCALVFILLFVNFKRRSIIQLSEEAIEDLNIITSELEQAISVMDAEDRVVWINKSFVRSFGFSEKEVLGQKLSNLIVGPKTNKEEVARMDKAIFEKKQAYTATILQYRKDKSAYWARVYLSPVLDDKGRLVKYIATSRDITKEKLVEEKMRLTDAQYKEINKAIDSTIYLYNVKEKKYEFISANSYTLLGFHDVDFYTGSSHTQVLVHPDDKDKVVDASIRTQAGETTLIEFRITVHGKEKRIREKSFPIYDSNNEVLKVSGVCQDITESHLQKEELKQRSALIAEQNIKIIDSINYAQMIQKASLGRPQDRLNLFPKSFVIYQPKDIVSGDFYRFDELETNDKEPLKAIIVADCTGHGVPGATLSLLCNSIIKQSLTEPTVNSTGEALTYSCSKLRLLFQQDDGDQVRDGMDVGCAVINPRTNMLYFSGACIDCYIVRDKALHVIEGDRIHVGLHDEDVVFQTQSFQLEKGDYIYMSSDGYFDQFGGELGKKFMKKRMVELFIEISELSMEEQKTKLIATLTEWKGDTDQTDDICLVGVQYKH